MYKHSWVKSYKSIKSERNKLCNENKQIHKNRIFDIDK